LKKSAAKHLLNEFQIRKRVIDARKIKRKDFKNAEEYLFECAMTRHCHYFVSIDERDVTAE